MRLRGTNVADETFGRRKEIYHTGIARFMLVHIFLPEFEFVRIMRMRYTLHPFIPHD